ncbi:MAG: hypothetical protein ACRC7B_00205 [Metamycoplasmataceae bacterium]
MKIKRILLGFGTVLLTTLPIVTMVACSSSESQESKRLETQVKKFKLSDSTTSPSLNALQAVQKVNLAPVSERIEQLKDFTRNGFLPTLNDGFDFEILSSNINKENNTIIDVIVRILEIKNHDNNKTITLKITGFIALSPLDLQLMKFNVTEQTINDTITSIEAVNQINEAVDQIAKKAALGNLANVPSVDAPKFTYEVKDVKISDRNPNEIYVTITVIEDPGTNNQEEDIIFAINGFKPNV